MYFNNGWLHCPLFWDLNPYNQLKVRISWPLFKDAGMQLMQSSDEIQSQHLSSGKMFDFKPLRGSSNSRRSFCLPMNIFDERVNALHPLCANLVLAAGSVTKRYS